MINDFTAPYRLAKKYPYHLAGLYALNAAIQLTTNETPNISNALFYSPTTSLLHGGLMWLHLTTLKDGVDGLIFDRGAFRTGAVFVTHHLVKKTFGAEASPFTKDHWNDIIADQPKNEIHDMIDRGKKLVVAFATTAGLAIGMIQDCSSQHSCAALSITNALTNSR